MCHPVAFTDRGGADSKSETTPIRVFEDTCMHFGAPYENGLEITNFFLLNLPNPIPENRRRAAGD